MNTKELKEIIKECVREVLREELTNIGKNYVLENYNPRSHVSGISDITNGYNTVTVPLTHRSPTAPDPNFYVNKNNVTNRNPIEKILEQTAREASMDPSKLGNYL